MGEARHSCPAGLQGILVMPPCPGGIISGPGTAPLHPSSLRPSGSGPHAVPDRSLCACIEPCPSPSGSAVPVLAVLVLPRLTPAAACPLTPTFDPVSMIRASVSGAWPRDTLVFGLPCRDGEAGCLSDHTSTQFVFHASDRRCRTPRTMRFFHGTAPGIRPPPAPRSLRARPAILRPFCPSPCASAPLFCQDGSLCGNPTA